MAAEQGDLETLRQCIESGVELNSRDAEAGSCTALHAAARAGEVDAMELLIKAGAAFERDGDGNTALHIAAGRGMCRAVSALIKLGADTSLYNAQGETPLHMAVKAGNSEMVGLLIRLGADVNQEDATKMKELPLIISADKNQKQIAELLLDNGADPNLAASDGATPIHLAAGWGTAARAPANKGKGLPDLVQMLLDYGADPNARDERQVTPLHAAAANDLYDAARVLIENGAQRLGDNKGTYPEDTAREKGHTRLLPLLKKAGTYPARGRMAITPQTGHSDIIFRMKFAPDGSVLATASWDKKVCLWTPDGILLQSLPHPRGIKDLAFSPDGNRLACVCETESVFLWDVCTGALLKEIPVKTPNEYDERASVAFHPSGQQLAVGSNRGGIDIVDLDQGVIRHFKAHKLFTYTLAFSHDGAVLVSSGNDKKLKFWNTREYTLVREIDNHEARQIAASPDGRRFVSTEGMEIWSFEGERLRGLGGGSMNQVSFSPDGSMVAGVSRQRLVVKTETNETVFETPDQGELLYSCAFKPDGKQVISGSQNAWLKIWDTRGKPLRTIKPETFSNWNLAVSPDRHTFAVCPSATFDDNLDPTIKIWNLDGRLEKVLGKFESDIRGLAYTEDGRYLFAAGGQGLYKWDMKTGESVFRKKFINALSVSVSGNGDRIVLGLRGIQSRSAILLDKNGDLLKVLDEEFSVEYPAISNDGRRIAMDHAYRVELFDIEGNLLHTTDAMARTITDIRFSPDSRYLVVAAGDLVLFDRDGKPIRTLDKESFFASPRSASFSPDSRQIAVGYEHGRVKVMDLSGKVTRTFEKHNGRVNKVAFTQDGGKLISVSEDGTSKVWSLAGGQHVTLASAGEEWIMYSPNGLFDSSRNGGRLVAMTQGKQAYGIDQFAIRNNRPDLILKQMDLGDQDLIDHYNRRYKKRLKRAGLDEKKLSSSLHVPEALITGTRMNGNAMTLNFSLKDSKTELTGFHIFVNDVPLYGSYGKALSGQETALTETVELTPGLNKIEISCVNAAGAESFRAITHAEGTEDKKRDLYFIGFGVSKYKNPDLDLKYAHKDVLDLADVFRKLEPQYNAVHIQTYVNEEVTRDSIKKTRESLMQARPNDTLVLFIAGHGVHDEDPDATYYYLTHEADLKNLSGTAAEFTLVEEILQGVPMRNKLFLMDTCESGEIGDDAQERFFAAAGSRGLAARTARGLSGTKQKKQGQAQTPKRSYLLDTDRYIYNDLIRRSGAIVFSSSRGGEFSYENDEFQNGLFTEEIMKALVSGEGDMDNNGQVSIDELRNYVMQAVPELCGNLQHPTVDRDNLFQKFAFPVVGQ
ncbi:MAG: ankyrin repeat domain-containing protein [Planctomycetota bacterium]